MTQFTWYLMPKFKDGKGVCVCKAHHSFADGLGFAQFLSAQSKFFDPKALPGMKPIPLIKKIVIWTLSPFLLLKTAFRVVFT